MGRFNCSGLAIEALHAVGVLRRCGDWTDHELATRFRAHERPAGTAECLAFWFTEARASHVELIVDNFHVVGASGGGSRTQTREDAIHQNACAKMRPVSYHDPGCRIVDLFMEGEM